MVTSYNEYLSKLYLIQSNNHLQNTIGNLPPIPIPDSKPLLKIDLNTRKIDAPSFLSVENDQKAETFFFEVDRFYNHIDLALTSCIIQYKTPLGSYIYPVPFYDTVSSGYIIKENLNENNYEPNKYYYLNRENNNTYELATESFNENIVYFEKQNTGKMYIPWQVNNNATREPGIVEYNIRFFSINTDTHEYEFNLNTLTAKSKILPSVNYSNLDLENDEMIAEVADLDELLIRVQRIEGKYNLFWDEMY